MFIRMNIPVKMVIFFIKILSTMRVGICTVAFSFYHCIPVVPLIKMDTGHFDIKLIVDDLNIYL